MRIPLYEVDSPCSYFDRTSSIQLASPDHSDATHYDILIHQGFRRDSNALYRPCCRGCQKCISTRIPVDRFNCNRTQRKIQNRCDILDIAVRPPEFSEEHFELFHRYEVNRHGGSMSKMTEADYENMLQSCTRTELIEYRDSELGSHPHRLRMVQIIDITATGLSAVYTFYDPDAMHMSLGTYGILSEILLTRQLRLPYLYLGYWIEGYPRMDYKQTFRPMQVFWKNQWVDIEAYLQRDKNNDPPSLQYTDIVPYHNTDNARPQ